MNLGISFILSWFLLANIACYSQSLMIPLDTEGVGSVISGGGCTVVMDHGERVDGEITSAVIVNGFLKSVNIRKVKNSEKLKFQAEEIQSLRIKANSIIKTEMVFEGAESIKEMTKTDFKSIFEQDSILFERALLPKKKDKYVLMQLLNPGYDRRIKVYANPEADETMGIGIEGVQLTGGTDKSYLLVKDNRKSILVKKKNYRQDFPELFGDCEKMIEFFGGDKIKFADLAGHVFAYDQLCE